MISYLQLRSSMVYCTSVCLESMTSFLYLLSFLYEEMFCIVWGVGACMCICMRSRIQIAWVDRVLETVYEVTYPWSRHRYCSRYISLCQKIPYFLRYFIKYKAIEYYTRIFFTISPYRSFFVVIFLLVKKSPSKVTNIPKNPIQKSISTTPDGFCTGDMLRSTAEIALDELCMRVLDGLVSVSMRKNDMSIIVIPIPTCVHFHIFLRTIPGSKSPRISPMAGKI